MSLTPCAVLEFSPDLKPSMIPIVLCADMKMRRWIVGGQEVNMLSARSPMTHCASLSPVVFPPEGWQ